MHNSEPGRRIISEINVTPMVDIMLVLLIIFMVTATYITRGAFDVRLPESGNGGDVADSPLKISISAEGALSLNGETTDMAKLRESIGPLLKEHPDVQAVVDGDKGVEYGRVMEVIDTLKSAGVKNFAAAVERVPGGAKSE